MRRSLVGLRVAWQSVLVLNVDQPPSLLLVQHRPLPIEAKRSVSEPPFDVARQIRPSTERAQRRPTSLAVSECTVVAIDSRASLTCRTAAVSPVVMEPCASNGAWMSIVPELVRDDALLQDVAVANLAAAVSRRFNCTLAKQPCASRSICTALSHWQSQAGGKRKGPALPPSPARQRGRSVGPPRLRAP